MLQCSTVCYNATVTAILCYYSYYINDNNKPSVMNMRVRV